MSPRFASRLAARWYVRRRWFLAVAVGAMILLASVVFLAPSATVAQIAFAAFGPLVFIPWSLLCLCSWFGPDGRLVGYPGLFRWYASLSLSAFFAMSLAWPLLVLFA